MRTNTISRRRFMYLGSAAAAGLAFPTPPPLLHFTRRIDVVSGLPVPLG